MSTCVVKVFSLKIYLTAAKEGRKSFAVVDGGGSALELLSDAAKLAYELRRVADRLVSVVRLLKDLLKLRGQKRSAVLAEKSVRRGVLLKILVKILVLIHFFFLSEKGKNLPRRRTLKQKARA